MMGLGSPAVARVVAVFFVLYALAYLDRNLIGILLPDIKADFGASDGELGLLAGASLAIGLSLALLPAGWLADRFDPRHVIAGGVLLWSATTVACGFAPDFRTLFAARLGVGVGEAVLTPAGLALIAASVPAAVRPRAMAIMTIGTITGASGALALGGWAAENVHRHVTLLAPYAGWRAAFIAVGSAGLVAALLPLLLPAAGRRRADAAPADLRAVTGFLRHNRRFAVPFLLAVISFNMFRQGFGAWLPAFFTRTFDWTATETGSLLGTASLVAGVTGTLATGVVATAWSRRTGRDATPWLLALAGGGLAVIAAATLNPASPALALGGASLMQGLIAVADVLVPVALMAVIPAAIRARVLGIYALAIGVTSYLLSAWAFGAAADVLALGDRRFWLPFAGLSVLFLALFTALMAAAIRPYRNATIA